MLPDAEFASLLYICGVFVLIRWFYPKYNSKIRTLLGAPDIVETVVGETTQKLAAKTSIAALFRSRWFFVGFVLLCISFVALERLEPYYFVQDDVHRGEFPVMLFACRTLWRGHLPLYNPYMLMGSPLLNLGYTSLTYPPTYFAYAISRNLLHNEYAMLEVFAILHIVPGYFVTYLLARRLRCSAMPATLAALCYQLSGSVLMFGRSWHAFVSISLYLPLLTLCAYMLVSRPLTWRWSVTAGLAIGLFFQVGFSQIWFYGVSLFVILVPLFCFQQGKKLKTSLNALPSLLFGIGISLPLLFQQFNMTRGITRQNGYGSGIIKGVFAMFLPYPLVQADHPDFWGTVGRAKMGCFYFYGGLFAFMLLFHTVLLLSSKPNKKLWRQQPIFICAVTVFMFCATNTGLWWVLCQLPIVGKVNNYPFRLFPYFVFFAVLCGSQFMERILSVCKTSAYRSRWTYVFGVSGLTIMMYYVSLAPPSFNSLLYKPYPVLPQVLAQNMLPADSRQLQRAGSYTLRITPHESAGIALNCNISSNYQIPVFNGYDPILEGSSTFAAAKDKWNENPLATARAYGLRWHLDETFVTPLTTVGGQTVAIQPFAKSLTLVGGSGKVALRELPGVDPLAFVTANTSQRLPIDLHGEGMDIGLDGVKPGSYVTVNFLWYPNMYAWVDDVSVAVTADTWGRMQVTVPSAAKTLKIRYLPPWKFGIWLGILVGLGGVALCARLLRSNQNAVYSYEPNINSGVTLDG